MNMPQHKITRKEILRPRIADQIRKNSNEEDAILNKQLNSNFLFLNPYRNKQHLFLKNFSKNYAGLWGYTQ